MRSEIRRKALHLLAVIFPIVYYYTNTFFVITFTGLAALCSIYIDIFRHKNKKIQDFLVKFFASLMRPDELRASSFKPTGSTWMLVGFFITSIFFPKEKVIVAWLILVFADTAAALVGKKIGIAHPKYGKSVEGSVIFFTCSCAICVYCDLFLDIKIDLLRSLIACMVTSCAEFVSKRAKIDDNLLIPIVFCIV